MRIAIATAVAAVLFTGTAHAQMAAPAKKTLYERLGGLPAITAVVDDFVGNVRA